MNLPLHQIDELCQLFSEYHEGSLSEGQANQLETAILGNGEARRLYVRFMRISAGLAWDLSNLPKGLVPGELLEDKNFAKETKVLSPDGSPSRHSGPSTKLNPIQESPHRQRAWMWTARASYSHSLLTAASVLVIGLAIMAIIRTGDGEYANPGSVNPIPEFAARVTGLAQCRWQHNNGRVWLDQRLSPGQRIELKSGYVELDFASGAKVLLTGPVVYVVESVNSSRLESGALTAKVPRQARGFSVDTHLAQVVDLGTEFAIEVSENESLQVHVFQGEVNVQFHEGLAASNAVPAAPARVRLKAGEALRRESSARPWITLAADADLFCRELPALAQAIPVPNFSFETPGVPATGWSFAVPVPWALSGPNAAHRGLATHANVGMPTSPGVTEGSQVLWLAIAPGNSGIASLSQSVAAVQPLTEYTLTVAVGWRQTAESTRVTEGIYTIEILLDGDVVGSNSIDFGASGDIPANEFVNLIAAYVSPADVDITKLLSVRLTASVAAVHEDALTGQALFDNVRLTAEPVLGNGGGERN